MNVVAISLVAVPRGVAESSFGGAQCSDGGGLPVVKEVVSLFYVVLTCCHGDSVSMPLSCVGVIGSRAWTFGVA